MRWVNQPVGVPCRVFKAARDVLGNVFLAEIGLELQKLVVGLFVLLRHFAAAQGHA
jgi:hypothetical protein